MSWVFGEMIKSEGRLVSYLRCPKAGLFLSQCEDAELNVTCGADAAPSLDIQSVSTLILKFSTSNPEQYISKALPTVLSSLECSLIARMWETLGPVPSSHTPFPKLLSLRLFVPAIH